MPGRTVPLVTGEYYHLYNRGTEEKEIFYQSRDYRRFQQTFYYYQFTGPKPKFSNSFKLKTFIPKQNQKMVEILCYCLMPNHFHFLVKQVINNGISKFMSLLCNSYTKYFNIKNKRVGPLVQGAFKSVLINNDEQILHLSRYIHLNPVVSKISENVEDYQWSSYLEYATGRDYLCSTKQILSFFPDVKEYLNFINAQKEYGITLELLKHSVIDNI